jgi:hypothetical protein
MKGNQNALFYILTYKKEAAIWGRQPLIKKRQI